MLCISHSYHGGTGPGSLGVLSDIQHGTQDGNMASSSNIEKGEGHLQGDEEELEPR